MSNPNQSYVQVVEVEVGQGVDSSAAADKKPVKTLGAGPLLPILRGILGILKKTSMPFTKVLKQSKPKHLDALEPSSTVDDGIVLPLHGAGEEVEAKTTAWDDDAEGDNVGPALDGHDGDGGVKDSLGRGFAHEVSDSHNIFHTITYACILSQPNLLP